MWNVGVINEHLKTAAAIERVLAPEKSSQRIAILPVTLSRGLQNLHTAALKLISQSVSSTGERAHYIATEIGFCWELSLKGVDHRNFKVAALDWLHGCSNLPIAPAIMFGISID